MTLTLRSISQRCRSEGVWATACDAASRAWRRAFRHRQIIYALSANDAAMLRPASDPTVRIDVHRGSGSLELSVRESLAARLGRAFLGFSESSLKSGAALYTLSVNGHVASLLWAKPGACVENWYVPVGESDVVLYGWWTDPEMRGRGLIGQLITASTRDALPTAERFLADVRVWNTPSIRAMERVGFRRIAEARPR